MRNLILFPILIAFFASCSSGNQLTKKTSTQLPSIEQSIKSKPHTSRYDFLKDSSKMALVIKTKKVKHINNNIIVELEFKNLSDSTIKLLNMFDPLYAFFFVKFVSKDGQIIQPALGAFIDPPPGVILKYIEIPKGKSYVKMLYLSTLINHDKVILEPKMYSLKIDFINYLGKDCILGQFSSNAIDIEIVN